MEKEQKNKLLLELRKISKNNTVSRKDIIEVCSKHSLPYPHFLVNNKNFRIGRGQYTLPESITDLRNIKKPKHIQYTPVSVQTKLDAVLDNKINMSQVNITPTSEKIVSQNSNVLHSNVLEKLLIPAKDSLYVKTNNHNTIKSILTSGMFYPIFITGLSGNGKTFSVEQVCSEIQKPLVRVNITSETEEDDLLGGFRLIAGETKWFDGPVIMAMKQGAILLLDEVDLGSTKIMCLQSVLEGRGVFLKKIGQYVEPSQGFNIVATANTKGQGDDTGRFLGANVLNEAFLERFPVWLEQDYPSFKQEERILKRLNKVLNINLEEEKTIPNFLQVLLQWAHQIRDGYKNEVHEDIITTRRLSHILRAYKIVGDPRKAVKLCLNRFNKETQESFYTLFEQFIPQPESSLDLNKEDDVSLKIDPEPLF
jgi:MoxR-like ATPase